MKKYILCVLSLLISHPVFAIDYTKLMINNDSYLVNLDEVIPTDGSPLIYIEGKQAPERAETELDQLAIDIFGTKDMMKVIKNDLEIDTTPSLEAPVQQEDEFVIQTGKNQFIRAGFMDHIADLTIAVQPIDNEHVVITERYNIINTDSDRFYERILDFPQETYFQLLRVVQNKKDITPIFNQQQWNKALQRVSISLPDKMEIGPNQVVLKYVLNRSMKLNQQDSLLNLNLTGFSPAFSIDRMNVLILFPDKVSLTDNKILFGTNQIEIPDAVNIKSDEQGRILYQFTHVIPENAKIQLRLVFNSDVFPTTNKGEDIFDTSIYVVPALLIIILCLYFSANIYWEKKQTNLTHFPAKISLLLPWELVTVLSSSITLNEVYNNIKTNNKLYKASYLLKLLIRMEKGRITHPFYTIFTRLYTFIHIMGEMCLGSFLLIFITNIMCSVSLGSINTKIMTFIIAINSISLCILYLMYFKSYKRAYLRQLATLAMTQHIITTLSIDKIQKLYPLICILHKQEEWKVLLAQNNPFYQHSISERN